jgi:hypothetical protein
MRQFTVEESLKHWARACAHRAAELAEDRGDVAQRLADQAGSAAFRAETCAVEASVQREYFNNTLAAEKWLRLAKRATMRAAICERQVREILD